MTFFEARRALVRFREFRCLAVTSWALSSNTQATGRVRYEIQRVALTKLSAMDGAKIPELTLHVGQRMHELLPVITNDAQKLGITLERSVQPRFDEVPPVVANVLTRQPNDALDVIDSCIGAAEEARQRGLVRLLVLVYWLIDIPALAVRWPWLILERAGLPPDIERNVVSNVLKVMLFVAYTVVVLALASNKVSPDLIRALIPK